MTDPDRNAFEAMAQEAGMSTIRYRESAYRGYQSADTAAAWFGWQAARARYAPKVTEQALANQRHAVAIALCKEEVPYDPLEPSCSANKNGPPRYHGWLDKAERFLHSEPFKAAIRAAGVRFKEEA